MWNKTNSLALRLGINKFWLTKYYIINYSLFLKNYLIIYNLLKYQLKKIKTYILFFNINLFYSFFEKIKVNIIIYNSQFFFSIFYKNYKK